VAWSGLAGRVPARHSNTHGGVKSAVKLFIETIGNRIMVMRDDDP